MDVEIVNSNEACPIYDLDGWERFPVFAKVYLIEFADRPVRGPNGGPVLDYRGYWKASLATLFREHPLTEGMRCLPVLAAAGSNARRFGSILARTRWDSARATTEQYAVHDMAGQQERHFITNVMGEPVEPTREVRVFLVGDRYYGVEKVGSFLAAP